MQQEPRNSKRRKPTEKGRPDYYLTPTRDFTQYTRDCEEKYWNKDTAFDWAQNVPENLRTHLENLPEAELSRIAFMVLPIVRDKIIDQLEYLRRDQLPIEEDALKNIGTCITSDRPAIKQALAIQMPLKQLQASVTQLEDQLDILQGELVDIREQQRLGLVRTGVQVKQMETAAEKATQSEEISHLTERINQLKKERQDFIAQHDSDAKILKKKIRSEMLGLEQQILEDLEFSLTLVEVTLKAGALPNESSDRDRLKDLIWKRQLHALKDIANHALVVEQSAIAPLTMGIIHYKRHREIQEAMTTFINDEAKHSATFRRFLVEKLEAKEFVSEILIRGANRYMWLARLTPGTGFFLAVIVEAIGAASLEFFGNEKYMPDPLFRSICKTIAEQDEKRHMDLCVATYNELYRRGTRWERWRNKAALRKILKSVYGDKTEDHRLIQAFRSFGVDSDYLYRHIITKLTEQLARISLYEDPEELLRVINKSVVNSR